MMTPEKLAEMQAYSPEYKVSLTCSKLQVACLWTGWQIAVSFSGGKDSAVLLDITAWLWSRARTEHGGKPLTVVYANTSNEFCGMEQFVRQYCAYIEDKHSIKIDLHVVRGEQTYYDVLRTEGYPIGSKHIAKRVKSIRKWLRESGVVWEDIAHKLDDGIPSADYLRSLGCPHSVILYMTGITQDNRRAPSYKLSLRWRPLIVAPFEVSPECCNILKKAPMKAIQHELGLNPVIAEMASDGQGRMKAYLKTGCNAFSGDKAVSKPMGFWMERDVLWYIDTHKLPTAPMYGDLVRQEDGTLRFTGEQRTGCKLCLFGCQFDHDRLFRLGEREPQTMDFALRPLADGGLGYREAVDYINTYCKCKVGYHAQDS